MTYIEPIFLFFSRDEPEDEDQTMEEEDDDAALLDITTDEAMGTMILSNEIPDSEGLLRMEGKMREWSLGSGSYVVSPRPVRLPSRPVPRPGGFYEPDDLGRGVRYNISI